MTVGNQGIVPLTVKDAWTGAAIMLGNDEHTQFEGRGFFNKGFLDIAGGANTYWYFMFRTPSLPTRINAHALFSVSVECEVSIYEGATVTADGTPITRNNCDRTSGNIAQLEAFGAQHQTLFRLRLFGRLSPEMAGIRLVLRMSLVILYWLSRN